MVLANGSGGYRYRPSGLGGQKISGDNVVRLDGPKGRFVFIDTSGRHRGRYGLIQPRLLATDDVC